MLRRKDYRSVSQLFASKCTHTHADTQTHTSLIQSTVGDLTGTKILAFVWVCEIECNLLYTVVLLHDRLLKTTGIETSIIPSSSVRIDVV